MKWIVTALTLLGGLLPAAGIYGIWRAFGERQTHLQGKLDRVDQVMRDPTIPASDKSDRLNEELPPEGTGLDVMYIRERLELELLRQSLPDVSTPAILASLGVACATAAGVLSTWSDM
ncbi:hypothetical protein [Streptomyces sp. NPDC052496]|uniref:hypothetical protein n=1 Tax=Streptomyces sp. NPDC052496 TaxID=3154951 RepID=UPI0034394B11